ncbi:MAG: diaminopimelate epimerase [Candidatus Rhabdochlamydia sp.]
MTLLFDKYHASGNDFIVVDDQKLTFCWQDVKLIQALCDRRTGVGADGLLLLQPSQLASFRMRIFNSDGSEALMCGNGLRCLSHFIFRHQIASSSACIEIGDLLADAQQEEETLIIKWGPYTVQDECITIEKIPFYKVNTGVPHAVAFTCHHHDFLAVAPIVRSHPLMGEEGVNVTFAVIQEGKCYLRTFERGVEQETLSCGSASAAVAILAVRHQVFKRRVTIVPASLEEIVIEVEPDCVRLQGKATFVFHGSIMYN